MANSRVIDNIYRLPARVVALLLRLKVNCEQQCDRRKALSLNQQGPGDSSDFPVYFCDGYHGGITFWDWIIIPGGGTWKIYNWPVVAGPILEQILKCPTYAAMFELDGHTLGIMADEMPEAVKQMNKALNTGRLEVVNGTYAQPLAGIFDGESYIRHFFYGLREIEAALSTEVATFASQEPAFFPQLPQLLNSFRYRQAVLRTHWAPFGTDPAYTSAKIKWQALDGSWIRAIPRYPFLAYGKESADQGNSGGVEMHYGRDNLDYFMASHLLPLNFTGYNARGFENFRKSGRQAGIDRPLLTRLEDFNLLSGAPLKGAAGLSASENICFVTVQQYMELLLEDQAGEDQPEQTICFSSDNFPCYYPWGLQGDMSLKASQEASHLLLEAERFEALALLSGNAVNAGELEQAWKTALQAQHHDLQLCGPWLSRKHHKSMGEVAVDLASAAKESAQNVISSALQALTGSSFKHCFDPETETVHTEVYNSLAVRRRDLAALPLEKYPDFPVSWTVAMGGNEREAQWLPGGGPGGCLAFLSDLPGFSGQTVIIRRRELKSKEPLFPQMITGSVNYENEYYRAGIMADGEMLLEDLKSRNILKGAYLTALSRGRFYDSRQGKAVIYQLASGPIADIYQIRGAVAATDFVQEITFFHNLPRIDINVTFNFDEGTFIGPQKEESNPDRAYYAQNENKLNLNIQAAPAESVLAGGTFMAEQRKISDFPATGFVAFNGKEKTTWALIRPGSNGFYWSGEKGLLQAVLAWVPSDWLYASTDSIRAGGFRYTVLEGNFTYRLSLQVCENENEALVGAADAFTFPFLVWAKAEAGEEPAVNRISVLPPLSPEAPTVTALFVNDEKVYLRLCNYTGKQKIFSFENENRRFIPVNMRLETEGASRAAITLRPGKIQTLQII